jgi:hypothetical protein
MNEPARAEVQTVACPKCGAPAGGSCRGQRGPRKSNHIQRVDAYKRKQVT